MLFNHPDELTDIAIAAAIRIHKTFGPGLLKSVYERMLYEELRAKRLHVLRQHSVSFTYNEIDFENGFRVDLVVVGTVLIEVKAVEKVKPIHKQQVQTYLRLMQCKLGLLINFGGETIREGLSRIVNDFDPGTASLLRVNVPPAGAS